MSDSVVTVEKRLSSKDARVLLEAAQIALRDRELLTDDAHPAIGILEDVGKIFPEQSNARGLHGLILQAMLHTAVTGRVEGQDPFSEDDLIGSIEILKSFLPT